MTFYDFVAKNFGQITQWVFILVLFIIVIVQLVSGYVTEDYLKDLRYVTTLELAKTVETLEKSISLLKEAASDEESVLTTL